MEVTKYTEYTDSIETGTVTVQVPEDEEAQVQIIINTGRSLILKYSEFHQICGAVLQALRVSGRQLDEQKEPGD